MDFRAYLERHETPDGHIEETYKLHLGVIAEYNTLYFWKGNTFEDLVADYRSRRSPNRIGRREHVRTIAEEFVVDDDGINTRKPLSGEQMKRLSEEVLLKLRGK